MSRKIAKEALAAYEKFGGSRPSGNWEWIFDNKKKAFVRALEQGDAESVNNFLAGFFQNESSYGIVSYSALQNKSEAHSAILRDAATFRDLCGDDFAVLRVPDVGEPWGVEIEGALVLPDAPRHYHHSTRLRALGAESPIFEIGGGYGGVFWYLWSGATRPSCYLNCDLIEALVVFYYFVHKCCEVAGIAPPRTKWTQQATASELASNDLVLMPAGPGVNIERASVGTVYNSNSLSEMGGDDVAFYFDLIESCDPRFIFHQNSDQPLWNIQRGARRNHQEVLSRDFPVADRYDEVYKVMSPWIGGAGRYREYLYQRRSG